MFKRRPPAFSATWDRFGRVVQQVWKVGTTPVDSYGYAYDHNSNRTQRTNALNSNLSESYTYDGLDRLVDTDRGGSAFQDWTLDALGNWNHFDGPSLSRDRTHDAANELTAISGSWIDPTYDDAGNMISGPKPGDETTEYKFVYDSWNRLVKVTDSAGTTTIAEYRYDGIGRRIAKLVPNDDDWDRTDYYYNEGWQCLEERYGEGQAKETVPDTPAVQWLWDVRYVDAPVLRWRSVSGTLDEVLYFCNDANMNVTALIDRATGEAVERYVYDPYGKATFYDGDWDNPSSTSAYANDILYCGYRFDPETGLDHVRYRYYHPTLARWLAREPISTNILQIHIGEATSAMHDFPIGNTTRAPRMPAIDAESRWGGRTLATHMLRARGLGHFVWSNSLWVNLYAYAASPANGCDPTGESWYSYIPLIGTIADAIETPQGATVEEYADLATTQQECAQKTPEVAVIECMQRINARARGFVAGYVAPGVTRGTIEILAGAAVALLGKAPPFLVAGAAIAIGGIADASLTVERARQITAAAAAAQEKYCVCCLPPEPRGD